MTGAVAGAVAVVLAGFHAIFFIFHFLVLGHDEFVKICGLVWKVPPAPRMGREGFDGSAYAAVTGKR